MLRALVLFSVVRDFVPDDPRYLGLIPGFGLTLVACTSFEVCVVTGWANFLSVPFLDLCPFPSSLHLL